MTAKRVDRRVLRTKRSLYDAILSLLQEQSYTSLTVQDITDRADVNRATFYAHFEDKEALLIEALDALFSELQEEATARLDALPIMNNMLPTQIVFEHVAQNIGLFEVLLGKTGPGFVMQRMIDALVEFGLAHYVSQYTPEMLAQLTVPPVLLPHHVAGSVFALLRWWVQEGMPYPPEQMAQMAHEIEMKGVWSMLGYEPEE